MKLADFQYDLPPSAIAQDPAEPRDHSKLLVLDRHSKALEHKHFYDIVDLLKPGDFLVMNSTKVFPARLRGRKATGGKIEVLLIDSFARSKNSNVERLLLRAKDANGETCRWRALVRGVTRSADLFFPEGLKARMVERLTEGEWVLEFSSDHVRDYLNRHGEMPLPPYIKRLAPRASDLDRYQTVYAKSEGAVAAPTAGFHFTPELLEKIHAKGVIVRFVVLHVGWGTFRPVRTDVVEEHTMLAESYEVSEIVADELTQARREGRRIIAVGTTAVRTLETIGDAHGVYQAGQGETSLFIYPGYRFKAVDALVTNFHLPDSTPLLLACAYYGYDANDPFSLRFAYEAAKGAGYRFYSYGDAMFIQ